MKRAVIMADGRGKRWNNYLGIPKHFAEVNGEPLILRTVRLLNCMKPDLEVIITSHDPRYDIPGSRRHEPQNNVYEIDRFTRELIIPDMCFLYGDAYYTEASVRTILTRPAESLLFFGSARTITAIKIRDDDCFRAHVDRVRGLWLRGEIDRCTGWQVYRSFTGQSFLNPIDLSDGFVFLDDETRDINSPEDYRKLSERNTQL